MDYRNCAATQPGTAPASERSGKIADVGAAVAESRSALSTVMMTGPAAYHSARPKRIKFDRIPPRGCERNNGILE